MLQSCSLPTSYIWSNWHPETWEELWKAIALSRLWTRTHASRFFSVVLGCLSTTFRPLNLSLLDPLPTNICKINRIFSFLLPDKHNGKMKMWFLTVCFFYALVFHVWEMFLSVFQPKQTHESPLWRQTVPVRVLHKGKWNPLPRDLPWALFGCSWIWTWSIKPGL